MAIVKTNTVSLSVSQRMTAGAVCLFLGAALVYVVGMSQIGNSHNAAHDTRHALGFPCH